MPPSSTVPRVLRRQFVEVVLARVPCVPAEADLARLPDSERDRASRAPTPIDAAAFVRGRAVLRAAAASRLAVPAVAVPLEVASSGHVGIAGSSLRCSIAHDGRWAIVALGTVGHLGVDIEPLELGAERRHVRPRELAAIARDQLDAPSEEVDAIATATPGTAARQFLRRWTLTEAVLKALGSGFDADLGALRIELTGQRPTLRRAPGVGPGDARRWRLGHVAVDGGHVAAYALDDPDLEMVVSRLD